ncbi:HopJ type III effector protein [Photobacterium ganghwense]
MNCVSRKRNNPAKLRLLLLRIFGQPALKIADTNKEGVFDSPFFTITSYRNCVNFTRNVAMEAFFTQLKQQPESVSFSQVMQVINDNYAYAPVTFSNGLGKETLTNPAGTNEGSCRIFAFAQLNKLTEAETLACFGEFYRNDVLQHPAGSDHQNIRHFMKYGWAGIKFDDCPLTTKP